jgi:hypothetical protein
MLLAPNEKLLYTNPLDCPHIHASWCDRILVVDAPVHFLGRGPCWRWTGWNNAKTNGAYGKVKVEQRTFYLHRLMWERHNALYLRGGETVDHLCRVRLCFNPYHLDCCDRAENTRRAKEYAKKFNETTYDAALEQEIQEGLNPNYWSG